MYKNDHDERIKVNAGIVKYELLAWWLSFACWISDHYTLIGICHYVCNKRRQNITFIWPILHCCMLFHNAISLHFTWLAFLLCIDIMYMYVCTLKAWKNLSSPLFSWSLCVLLCFTTPSFSSSSSWHFKQAIRIKLLVCTQLWKHSRWRAYTSLVMLNK